eukprot:3630831-Rhodomonas_salina.1
MDGGAHRRMGGCGRLHEKHPPVTKPDKTTRMITGGRVQDELHFATFRSGDEDAVHSDEVTCPLSPYRPKSSSKKRLCSTICTGNAVAFIGFVLPLLAARYS